MADGGRKPWEQTLEEIGAKVEDDVRRVVTYLNDEVVPDVRRNGSEALRAAAIELQRLADRMDGRGPQGPSNPAGPPPTRTGRG